MDLTNLQEQFSEINKAIATIQEGGQSYRIGNRQLSRADLSLLYKERDRITGEINAQENGGIFRVAVFNRR